MLTTTESGGGEWMKRAYVSSVSSSGFSVTMISEPSLRIVGIRMSHERLETAYASSTHTLSTPSNDLIDSAVWSLRPENRNSVPFAPLMTVYCTS